MHAIAVCCKLSSCRCLENVRNVHMIRLSAIVANSVSATLRPDDDTTISEKFMQNISTQYASSYPSSAAGRSWSHGVSGAST